MALRWLVKAHLPSLADIDVLRSMFHAEVLRSTLHRIDEKNVVVDAIVHDERLREVQSRYRIEVIGEMNEMTRTAAAHVSRTNRYRSS